MTIVEIFGQCEYTDEVTQFEIVCSVEKITEIYLIPALQQLLDAFPFTVLSFHSDNGSEYINKRVLKAG